MNGSRTAPNSCDARAEGGTAGPASVAWFGLAGAGLAGMGFVWVFEKFRGASGAGLDGHTLLILHVVIGRFRSWGFVGFVRVFV